MTISKFDLFLDLMTSSVTSSTPKTISLCAGPSTICGPYLVMIWRFVLEIWWDNVTNKQTNKQTDRQTDQHICQNVILPSNDYVHKLRAKRYTLTEYFFDERTHDESEFVLPYFVFLEKSVVLLTFSGIKLYFMKAICSICVYGDNFNSYERCCDVIDGNLMPFLSGIVIICGPS